MATITIRRLSEEVRRALKRRAAENHRSMEAEAREVLEQAVARHRFVHSWLAAAERVRALGPEPGGQPAEDLDLPARSAPRPVDLG
jgi:plasmid stability protein